MCKCMTRNFQHRRQSMSHKINMEIYMRAALAFTLMIMQSTQIVVRGQTDFRHMRIRLNRGLGSQPITNTREGRVEVSLNNGRTWGTMCSTNWSLREGNVVCRELGLGYAAVANQSTIYGNSQTHPWGLVGTLCRGNEPALRRCSRELEYPSSCNSTNRNVAIVQCVSRIADLQLILPDIERSGYLDLVPLSSITCALEEKCVAPDAYEVQRTNPHAIRKLLRFTTKADNVGTADFSPYANYEQWQWHQCHNHYHSMEVFATFDIYDMQNQKKAVGHKASFCLMDVECRSGLTPLYSCGNRTQGITAGCADIYHNSLDCQWVDVTNLKPNMQYKLRVAINPEYKIGEMSFENNGAECTLIYTGARIGTRLFNCHNIPLWFKR